MLREKARATFEWLEETEERIDEWGPTGNVYSDWFISRIANLVWFLAVIVVGVGLVGLCLMGPGLLAGSLFGQTAGTVVVYTEMGLLAIAAISHTIAGVIEDFREYRDQHSAA